MADIKKRPNRILIPTTFLVLLTCLNVKSMTNIKEEVWKSVPDYEGYYKVSNLGNIRSCDRVVRQNSIRGSVVFYGQPIKPYISSKGYNFIRFTKNGKRGKNIRVHRLVAELFVPNPNNLPEVNHKDLNKFNNHASNLEWINHQDNIAHAVSKGAYKNRKRNGKDKSNCT